MENQTPTFVQSLKAGAMAGVAAAVLNSIWNVVAQSLGSVPPPNFTMAVIMASIVPVLLGSIIYFLLLKFTSRGKLIFLDSGRSVFAVQFWRPHATPNARWFANPCRFCFAHHTHARHCRFAGTLGYSSVCAII